MLGLLMYKCLTLLVSAFSCKHRQTDQLRLRDIKIVPEKYPVSFSTSCRNYCSRKLTCPPLSPLRPSELRSRYRHRHRQERHSSRTKHRQRNRRHERPRTRRARPSACCPLPASAWRLVPKTAPLLCPTPSPNTINHHPPHPLCCSTRTDFLLPSGVLLAGERVRSPEALLGSRFSGSWLPWKAKV